MALCSDQPFLRRLLSVLSGTLKKRAAHFSVMRPLGVFISRSFLHPHEVVLPDFRLFASATVRLPHAHLHIQYEFLPFCGSSEAYEKVEDLRAIYYMPRRWKDYNSFRIAFHRYNKKTLNIN